MTKKMLSANSALIPWLGHLARAFAAPAAENQDAAGRRERSGKMPKPREGGFARRAAVAFACLVLLACANDLRAAGPAPRRPSPVLAGNVDRPLRYRPDNDGFVIENGQERFNRPLYGSRTAFRVDAGDRPIFSLYLPGRGGNLRLGLKTQSGAKWLDESAATVTRYAAGRLAYELRDPLFGDAPLRLTAVAMSRGEGFIVRLEPGNALPASAELIVAVGGSSGERARRDGDIGTEPIPISQFFELKPEHARGNSVEPRGDGFVLHGKTADLVAILGPGAKVAAGDATQWNDPQRLLDSAGKAADAPVAVATLSLKPGAAQLLAIHPAPPTAGATTRGGTDAPSDYRVSLLPDSNPSTRRAASNAVAPLRSEDLARACAESEADFDAIARRIVVRTPDPFINAAVPAVCVSADSVWDDRQQAFMHGAVAWRTKLLGWRGAYSGDTLGLHERTRNHLENWFPRQNTDPPPTQPIGPDPEENLARSERWLHTNGDLTKSHYDMNLVAIDALFRHLLWTGDMDYARKVWPVIERHLAWERRLFRRPFGDAQEELPLYEAYACIWASDDLQYHGGGATHSTAYNLYHNRQAARVARWIGADATPYEREAELIARAMRRELWLADRGWYAEFKDLLGKRLVHPAAAAWTHYHTIDSEAADPFQAWQMTRQVETQLARIPVRGPGVPDGHYTIATTRWMPYLWSINNVVMGETIHTALAGFQAGRAEQGFALLKGALLDSMYTGLCPGNVGMATKFDAYRSESQRDFSDGVGITSRAIVEGLFGLRPDALAGELTVRPGFPSDWSSASIEHPKVRSSFTRDGDAEKFVIESRFTQPMRLRLRVRARAVGIASITVNGQSAEWKGMEEVVGRPEIEVVAAPAERWEVSIRYRDAQPAVAAAPAVVARGEALEVSVAPATLLEVFDPQQALADITRQPQSLSATAAGEPGHRTAFAKVRQGDLTWWLPVTFEVRPPIEIIPTPEQSADALRFVVRNNTAAPLEATAAGGAAVIAAPMQDSEPVTLPADHLVPGANIVALDIAGGGTVRGEVTNWNIKLGDRAAKLEPIALSGAFNDRVTQIFANEYLSPRSPYCSLALPKHGFGGWATNKRIPEISDTGLRAASDSGGGRIALPQGIAFATPGKGDAPNVAFVSQWDNYPRELAVPLEGRSSHAWFLVAGSTNAMQSRLDNGEIVVTYADGSTATLALHNPTNWWPIEQDYFTDDFAFARAEPVPPRVDLKTGEVRLLDAASLKGRGRSIAGGAATVVDLPLDPEKPLKSVTVRAIANEVVIGLMGVTLAR
ncbi:MAG TPA: DUF4450 domain-containing protein [Tepidisphaeraceae bacterium]|nr:DUF4450 domain-containing protein [Tepidisphaeraceae bacterium]